MAQRTSPEDARTRLLKRSDLTACKAAFTDREMPRAERKESHLLAGPGAAPSRDPMGRLTKAHGFSPAAGGGPVQAATARGFGIGHAAPLALLPPTTRAA